MKRILLLSAYDTISHIRWRECLVEQLDQFEWTTLTLPPRYFNFRIRTSALSWFYREQQALSQQYDLIIATSLSDISLLKALCPQHANTAFWLYCHENQFAYPKSSYQQDAHLSDAKTAFLMNCVTAERISFNSHYNRDTAIAGLRALLKAWPEKIPAECIDDIIRKSDVLPVPVSIPPGSAGGNGAAQASFQDNAQASFQDNIQDNVQDKSQDKFQDNKYFDIVWNHRWEYDKGPEYLLELVETLIASLKQSARTETKVRLHVVGKVFRTVPEAFNQLREYVDSITDGSDAFELGKWGYIESNSDYCALLASAQVVLSTSRHDFQGLSILEAVANRCVPLLPDDLVYPEIFAKEYLYQRENGSSGAKAAVTKLLDWIDNGLPAVPAISAYSSQALIPKYSGIIQKLTQFNS